MSGLKRGSVAVVGAAESDLGLVAPHTSPVDMMAQATMRALDDCGLKLSDIDGIFNATSQIRLSPMALAEYLRMKPDYFDGTIIGGSSFMSHVAHAQGAIQAGLCEVALITYGSTQRSVSRAAASPREYNYYETPYKPILPASAYALAAARHMHEFGTTREQLAEVAVLRRSDPTRQPRPCPADLHRRGRVLLRGRFDLAERPHRRDTSHDRQGIRMESVGPDGPSCP